MMSKLSHMTEVELVSKAGQNWGQIIGGVIVVGAVLACCVGCCHAIFTTKDGQGGINEVLSIVIGFFIPPIGIWWRFGCGIHFIICLVLTLCGYVPGVIFAMVFIICKPTENDS